MNHRFTNNTGFNIPYIATDFDHWLKTDLILPGHYMSTADLAYVERTSDVVVIRSATLRFFFKTSDFDKLTHHDYTTDSQPTKP